MGAAANSKSWSKSTLSVLLGCLARVCEISMQKWKIKMQNNIFALFPNAHWHSLVPWETGKSCFQKQKLWKTGKSTKLGVFCVLPTFITFVSKFVCFYQVPGLLDHHFCVNQCLGINWTYIIFHQNLAKHVKKCKNMGRGEVCSTQNLVTLNKNSINESLKTAAFS